MIAMTNSTKQRNMLKTGQMVWRHVRLQDRRKPLQLKNRGVRQPSNGLQQMAGKMMGKRGQ
jgi:hypothetical protein